MDLKYLADLVDDLNLAVVLCGNTEAFPIVYMNVHAQMLFDPSHSVERLTQPEQPERSINFLNILHPELRHRFRATLCETGRVDDFRAEAIAFDGKPLQFLLSGNVVSLNAQNDHVILFLSDTMLLKGQNQLRNSINDIYYSAFFEDNVENAIQNALATAGRHMNVSRVYIFEEISPTTTSNTYEWCAPGVEPAIQGLKELAKEDYNYDVIVSSGMYITQDVSQLPDGDREILEAQGIRALAIIPFYDHDKPLGYVGFDDCEQTRKWSHDEIQVLQSVARLLVFLIKRRDAERSQQIGQRVLQLISDNSGEVIYVNSLDDYTLLFVSRGLADSLGVEPEDLLGKKCWQVLQKDQQGPCPFCPIPKLSIEPGADRSEVYVWENFNAIAEKTYVVKDNLMRWYDGSIVHLETALDISQRKQYEDNLRRIASTDAMTGVYNREWGGNELEAMLQDKKGGSLCFIDVDGLKKTNDEKGHSVGDKLLSKTVRLITENITESEFLCRWGGDEFLLWMQRDVAGADELVRAIQKQMDAYNAQADNSFYLSFSYGIVPFEGESFDEIVKNADQLMYQNKIEKRGLNRRRRRSD